MRRKRIVLWLVLTLAVIAGGAGVYAYQIYSQVNQTLESVHEPMPREPVEKREEPIELKQLDPISILLIGSDRVKQERGRSDSLVLLTINPTEQKTKVVSIPRDTYVKIEGKGKQDKINHAYAFGGVPMTLNTVESFLEIPIDYYVEVNMDGFRQLIDALGGVSIENERAFTYERYAFQKGSITLSGNEALAYTRMRKEDPRGDFGRQERQRQVIEAVLQKGASLSSLANYGEVLQAIQHNVRTNLTVGEMYELHKDYRSAAAQVEQLEVAGEGKRIGRLWYYVVAETKRQALSQQLRQHLGLFHKS